MSLRRASALALSISAAVSGLLLLWAVLAAPEQTRTPLAWCGGAAAVLLTAAVTVAAHATARARELRETLAAARRDSERFARETVPGLVARLRSGDSASTALAATKRTLGTLDDEPARAVLATLATEVGRGEASRAAAMSACANAAGRMQALATGMLADLREMEHRHADEDVLGDLLHLDHRTAQAGRLADSIAILTGARSGRRWAKPIVMESVLRGAMGRINGYQRVRLHSTSEMAVAGHAAEGVMHALAELLDNAANFSPPTAEVHVYVEEVPAGLIITVEDSGLVMSDVQLRRAERAVCASTPLDLTSLSGTRLGLAVVGCLARKHQLKVSFRPSARGGTGALMLLPQELLTQPAVPASRHDTGSTRLPRPVPAETAPTKNAPTVPLEAAADAAVVRTADPVREDHAELPVRDREATPDHALAESAAPADRTAPSDSPSDSPSSETTGNIPQFGESGLPKRRRGRTLAAAHPAGPDAPPRPVPPKPARTEPALTKPPRTDPALTDPALTEPARTEPAARPAAADRFSTFRRAVQGQDKSQDTGQHPLPPTAPSPHSHPEGNENR
ncbi:ATP-binding protein [Streptomyces sp. NPDC021093]|uniref:sensor histidine kinase n=1 Tax=Streptomyces sp. NPDC021093 TaxID=3365112 RepID=UPI00379A910E